jgi:hypothetical protein
MSTASCVSSLSKTIVMASFSGYTSGDVLKASSFHVVLAAAAAVGGFRILTLARGELSFP